MILCSLIKKQPFSSRFQTNSIEYRKLCYLRPIRAKNYLLDLVNFDGTPYNRGGFQFIGIDDEPTKAMIALWQEIEKSLFSRNNQHT